MKKLLCLALIAVCSSIPAYAQTIRFPSIGDGVTQFVMPGIDVGCTYIPFDGANGIDTGQNSSELHCYSLPNARLAVSLGIKGKARKLLVTRSLDCCAGNHVLAFGKEWAAGGYKCKSERSGLTCTRGRHGFVISGHEA